MSINRSQYWVFCTLIAVIGSIVLPGSALGATTSTTADIRVFMTGSEDESRWAAQRLRSDPVDTLATWIEHFNGYTQKRGENGFTHYTHEVFENVRAPAFLYVPTKYNPKVKRPVVIFMHGGVGKRDFPPYTDDVLLTQNKQLPICEEHNWFFLFPEARYDCAWWTSVGMDNIEWLLREVKRDYNIDDDRVCACGFSDGASGSFQFCMSIPTPFAQFFPWSGYIASGSMNGNVQQILANMRNRPVYSTSGGNDRLYPTAMILPLIQLAQHAGADLHNQSFDTSGHDAGYMELVYPEFKRKVEQYHRKSFRTKLYWEASDLQYGTVDWLSISELDLGKPAASWYVDYNQSSTVDAFPRKSAAGAVSAQYANNTFEIKTSRVGQITLYLHPKMVHFEQPVKVVINGKTAFDGMVQKDARWMMANFLEKRDRGQLWEAKLDVKVP